VTELFREGKLVIALSGGTPLEYRFDPQYPEAAQARLAIDEVLQRAAGRQDAIPTRDRPAEIRGTRYIEFLIPGLLGMNIMSSSLWGIGWNIASARKRKLLKQLLATPMKRSHYLLSHIFSRLVFLVAEVSVLVLFARLAFDVNVMGNLAVLSALTIAGAMCFAGIALLIASRTQTVETVSGLINVVMMPMTLLSGVFFSSSHFPDWMQPFIALLPLTALNDGLRAVFMGAPLDHVLWPMAILSAVAVATFLVSLKIFRWN
jgi:ABC-2 type transport system permease protein